MVLTTSLDRDGCAHWPAVASGALTADLLAAFPEDVEAGQRLPVDGALVTGAMMAMLPIAQAYRDTARPVRAVVFDKSPRRNWLVPWHQDRMISVSKRIETPGFGPWSVKSGVPHVEPPFAILAAMVTLRLHLDPCPADNAPLRVALGSHRRRIAAEKAMAVADACHQTVCVADAGDIWAYATPVLHCSARAQQPSRRRVLQVDFSADTLPEPLEWLR